MLRIKKFHAFHPHVLRRLWVIRVIPRSSHSPVSGNNQFFGMYHCCTRVACILYTLLEFGFLANAPLTRSSACPTWLRACDTATHEYNYGKCLKGEQALIRLPKKCTRRAKLREHTLKSQTCYYSTAYCSYSIVQDQFRKCWRSSAFVHKLCLH